MKKNAPIMPKNTRPIAPTADDSLGSRNSRTSSDGWLSRVSHQANRPSTARPRSEEHTSELSHTEIYTLSLHDALPIAPTADDSLGSRNSRTSSDGWLSRVSHQANRPSTARPAAAAPRTSQCTQEPFSPPWMIPYTSSTSPAMDSSTPR